MIKVVVNARVRTATALGNPAGVSVGLGITRNFNIIQRAYHDRKPSHVSIPPPPAEDLRMTTAPEGIDRYPFPTDVVVPAISAFLTCTREIPG